MGQEIKLAEALLLRKELQGKLDRLKQIKQENLFEVKSRRQSVNDNTDDIVVSVPRISLEQVIHCYDWHSKQLRLIDAAIQQANWECDVPVSDLANSDYVDPYIPKITPALAG